MVFKEGEKVFVKSNGEEIPAEFVAYRYPNDTSRGEVQVKVNGVPSTVDVSELLREKALGFAVRDLAYVIAPDKAAKMGGDAERGGGCGVGL